MLFHSSVKYVQMGLDGGGSGRTNSQIKQGEEERQITVQIERTKEPEPQPEPLPNEPDKSTQIYGGVPFPNS
jgi:hypothetical protein